MDAAGNLLELLTNFRLGITDVVKQETIDKARGPQASYKAKQLLTHQRQTSVKLSKRV